MLLGGRTDILSFPRRCGGIGRRRGLIHLSAAVETPQVERLKVGEGSDGYRIVLIPNQARAVLEGVETGRGAPNAFEPR